MNEKFNKLMMKKKEEGKMLSPVAKDAKMGVLKDLHKMASDSMADKIHGLKKVSVMAPDSEGLAAGLHKAEDLVGQEDEMVEDAEDGDSQPDDLFAGGDTETKEEMHHADLDGDNEEGESPEHQEAVLGHHDGEESDDELTAKIAELLAKQKHRASKRS